MLPLWTLNNVTAPVTQYDLLVSGVNLLLPPRKVLKEQSRAKHTVNLRKCLVKHHAGLNQRLLKIPDQTLAPVELISITAEDSKEVTQEDMQRATRAREFALKLTTAHQYSWQPDRNPSTHCCR